MALNREKAQIILKLARKGNWGGCHDKTEHFKRFQNLNEAIKELEKIKWLIIHKKPNFIRLSLNSEYKKEIIEFIEQKLPEFSGMIK